ncbi:MULTISPECIES: pyruvate, water dikinase regulatory protein [Virgibacillus]|uniref:Putative pyruvate, phosphate dikinase regulatory protein n=1 Tax=Virgibacillus pantothenticus TaxID=1473 RepID=A0A0L0QQQ0_VIRPA|nr:MULTISPECIES: pyruvate, water dikinase regulatory protein [Virgibacillus]API90563.1 phosphoenolpyruvate synthase regulatory protein [Virgibacillus sp. 6R]KNE20518.1 phosphotransferase [Virgibacillus pantothenticus]MBS7429675.1 kinase/pyrophosphorylase [Virgibacillus sp. 19R1-5]MBU8565550.1 kinase/pyrophosphorylase [Virgibacillus pantothenticus]MBU8599848.1 kinase/pyrophosphorylase [Virgibacillus pantothenticus]
MYTQPVYVLSDSVGETAELVIKAGLSQFNHGTYKIQRIPYVEDKQTIDEALQLAVESKGLIGFTLVDPILRNYVNERAKQMNLEAIDIMGPVLKSMERVFEHAPRMEAGLVHKLDEDYFKRIEAIEFAVKYDDGRDSRGIARADIVLIGVSRTSKTPLSQYLAHKRLKVANVPIVPEVDPPEELFEVDAAKCIGLRINAEKLYEIRKERLRALGLGDQATYANMERIHKELEYFDKIVNKIGCEVIDVSNKAVEETANSIRQIVKK